MLVLVGIFRLAMRSVALGSILGSDGLTAAFASEKGRKGGESASSCSSSSESGPKGGLGFEGRGRRMYARLLDRGAAVSDSEDEEEVESSALLEELAVIWLATDLCSCAAS